MNVFIANHPKLAEICLKVSDTHLSEVTDLLFDLGFKVHNCEPYHYVKMAEESKARTVSTFKEAAKFEAWIKSRLSR